MKVFRTFTKAKNYLDSLINLNGEHVTVGVDFNFKEKKPSIEIIYPSRCDNPMCGCNISEDADFNSSGFINGGMSS